METNMSENTGTGEALQLDVSVLNERGETYTSLMDLYSIAVFTDQMQERQGVLKQEKDSQEKQLQESVWDGSETVQNEDDGLQDKLFTAAFTTNKKISYEQEQAQNYLYYIGGGILLVIIVLGLMIRYINTRKKKRKEYEGENVYE